jgi:Zn-dependent protease with chaperone function
MQPSGFRSFLESIRKPDLSQESRDRVLAGLPRAGEIKPSGKQRQKLLALAPILQYHRRDGFVEVKVIDAFQAAVGLHARSFILISEPALRELDSEELQAVAAHELGHDYFWDDYQLALDRHDAKRAQELELRCDAIAIFTLANLGLKPRKLISAIERLDEFNAQFGTALNERLYVPPPERVRFIEAIITLAHPVVR